MRRQQSCKHITFAVLAVVCPVIAFLFTLSYQYFANADFWASLSDKEGTTDVAGAMMAFAVFVQLIFFTMIGCFVGIIFAAISFSLWRKTKVN